MVSLWSFAKSPFHVVLGYNMEGPHFFISSRTRNSPVVGRFLSLTEHCIFIEHLNLISKCKLLKPGRLLGLSTQTWLKLAVLIPSAEAETNIFVSSQIWLNWLFRKWPLSHSSSWAWSWILWENNAVNNGAHFLMPVCTYGNIQYTWLSRGLHLMIHLL